MATFILNIITMSMEGPDGPKINKITPNKIQNINNNNNVEDFSKTAGKDKLLSDTNKKKESETKKSEWDPVENLNASLYPTEKDVGDWMINTVKLLNSSPISDQQKWAFKNMLKSAQDTFLSQDVNKLISVRQTLSFINDEIKRLLSNPSVNPDIQTTTPDNTVVSDKTWQNEGKEFKQIVMDADWEWVSMDQTISDKKATSAAKGNLLKLNWLATGRISNYRQLYYDQVKLSDGNYRTTIKIEGTVTPL